MTHPSIAEQIRALSLNLHAMAAAFEKVPGPAVRHLLDRGLPDEALLTSFTAGYVQACNAAMRLVLASETPPENVFRAVVDADTESNAQSFNRLEACTCTLLSVLDLHDPTGVLWLRVLVRTALRATQEHPEQARVHELLRAVGVIAKENENPLRERRADR